MSLQRLYNQVPFLDWRLDGEGPGADRVRYSFFKYLMGFY